MGTKTRHLGRDDQEPPYVFSEQIGYLLRRAYQRHLAIFQAEACDPQLTSVQFSTLCALQDGGRQSQAELVKTTGVDQATIRGILDRLKSRGLVAMSKDAADGRKVMYAATRAGLDVVASMVPHARAITEMTFGSLNAGERAALVFTLRKMLQEDDDPPPR